VKRIALLLVPALAMAGTIVTSSSPSEVVLSVLLPAPIVTVTTIHGNTFAHLSLPEAGIADEFGAPQLPIIRKLIEIPYGAEVSVNVTGATSEVMALAYRLLPVQPPIPKTGPAPEFVLDEKAYRENRRAPELWARVQSVAEVRNHRLALIEINPVHYLPVSGTIEYLTSAAVEIKLTGSDLPETQRRFRELYSRPFEEMLRGLVLNFGAYQTDPPPSLPVGYLIIVPDAWYNNVLPLAQWRRQKGLEVTVTKLSTIGGGGSTQVLAYIQNAYNTWPIRPSYVLLVGDVDNIGYFIGQGEGNPDTDLNYAMLAGSDYLPDICVSRASVASVAELDSLVRKTVKYEKNQWMNGTGWAKKSYFIASADGGNHGVAERTHQYCMRKIRPLGVVCDTAYLYYNNAIAPVEAAINDGRSFVIYSGHGGETEWAETNPVFDVGVTHQLTNSDKVPFVATYACLTGSYASVGECFSESWIRAGYRGAICDMASSVTSYWTEDDTFQRRLFDCLYDSSYTWIMSAIVRAKLWYIVQMGNNATTRRYFEMYNLMGDGAVDIYWDVPHALTVTHPYVIPIGAYNLHVTVQDVGAPVRNALVCAAGKNDTTVHTIAYTDNSGVVDLAVNTSAPDSIYLTVTGHNLAPYLGAVVALPSSGPYIMRLRSTVDDAAGGNGDGIINPGETVNLPTWVKNCGQGPGTGITGTLRTIDPAATVLDSVKTFGDIAAGDSAYTGSSGFRFHVGDTCSNGHNITLLLVCKDSRDSSWSSPFSLSVGTGILSYSDKRVEDPAPGGNNNGRIDPDETAQLYVVLRNTGLGHAYNTRAILRSGDSRFHVTDSVGVFGTVRRDTFGENTADPFVVHADAGILPETSIPCTLTVTADGGYGVTLSFAVVVGEIRSTDPIPDNMAPPLYWAYDDVDSNYVEHPVFNWIETRGRGTRLTLSDDQTVEISLPSRFGPWKYYSQRYTNVSVCGNGFVAAGSTTSAPWTNAALPTSDLPAPAVCLNWDDLYPPDGGGVWWFYDSLNHAFVVEWDSVCYYPSGSGLYDKFELVIYDTTRASADGQNKVLAQYLTADNYVSNTVGIQNQDQTIGINCLCDGAYTRGASPIAARSAIKYVTGYPATSIAERPSEMTKLAGLSLRLNPNPFKALSRICWTIPIRARVALGLFDVSGRFVRTVCNSELPAGSYSFSWDGTDDQGRLVSEGIYFCRLTTENSELTRKVVLSR
jgi:hypothetical protein